MNDIEFVFEDDPIVIYLEDKTPSIAPSYAAPQRTAAYQYIWDDRSQSWEKLVDTDPDPSPDLVPGEYDGQIIDVEFLD